MPTEIIQIAGQIIELVVDCCDIAADIAGADAKPAPATATTLAITARPIVAILLAAGSGRRFDPQGQSNKLLAPISDGTAVAVAAASNLRAVFSSVLSVVRKDDDELAEKLRQAGCEVVVCAHAEQGMAASLVQGVTHASDASGWLIALADMPLVKPATLIALRQALLDGANIAAPIYAGRRGNPVAFDRCHQSDLLALRGDVGARDLLEKFTVTAVIVDDPGVLQDIDTLADLQRIKTIF